MCQPRQLAHACGAGRRGRARGGARGGRGGSRAAEDARAAGQGPQGTVHRTQAGHLQEPLRLDRPRQHPHGAKGAHHGAHRRPEPRRRSRRSSSARTRRRRPPDPRWAPRRRSACSCRWSGRARARCPTRSIPTRRPRRTRGHARTPRRNFDLTTCRQCVSIYRSEAVPCASSCPRVPRTMPSFAASPAFKAAAASPGEVRRRERNGAGRSRLGHISSPFSGRTPPHPAPRGARGPHLPAATASNAHVGRTGGVWSPRGRARSRGACAARGGACPAQHRVLCRAPRAQGCAALALGLARRPPQRAGGAGGGRARAHTGACAPHE